MTAQEEVAAWVGVGLLFVFCAVVAICLVSIAIVTVRATRSGDLAKNIKDKVDDLR